MNQSALARSYVDVSHLRHLLPVRDHVTGVRSVIDLKTGARYPMIGGGARGAHDSDMVMTTADNVQLDVVWDDLQLALDYYAERAQDAVSRWTFRTRQSGWKSANSGTMRWEKGTEYSRPFRQRVRPTFTSRGLPVWDFEFGLMYTRKYLLRASAQEIENTLNEVMRSDQENILMEVYRALLNDTNYTFDDDETGTTLNVLAAYNGDAEVPPMFGGKTFTAPHTHFHSSNGAPNEADIDQLKTDLTEHGFDGNRELVISADEENVVRGLVDTGGDPIFYANWAYENPNVDLARADTQRTISGVGPEYIGVVKGFKVRIDRLLPDNYYIGTNLYGDNSPLNPLAFRERRNDAEVGLQLVNEDGTGTFPIVNSFYLRSFGVAALNRGNISVMVSDAGTSYINPTASFASAT